MNKNNQVGQCSPEKMAEATAAIAQGLGLPVSKELGAAIELLYKATCLLSEIDNSIDVKIERDKPKARA